MECIVKHFQELTTEELFLIYKLRVSVFVVEQQCPYQEVDDFDRLAYHVFFRDQEGLQAYLRVLPRGTVFPEVSIGRVISVHRRQGIGSQLLDKGIETARDKFGAGTILIEAQTYAKPFYERAGFIQTSDEFLEDGIPHIQMRLDIH